MQVHFKIHGQGKKNLNGDGLAIWYSKERMQKGERCRCGRPRGGAVNTLCLLFYRPCLWKYGQLYWSGRVCGHVS